MGYIVKGIGGSGFSLIICLILFWGVFDVRAQEPVPISREKFDEKFEFYRVSYSPFKYQEAREEAEKRFPLLKKGTFITVESRLKRVSGEYKGYQLGRIYVGSEMVLIRDVSESQWYKFDKELCEEIRRKYIEENFRAYRNKRAADIENFKKELASKYAIITNVDAKDNPESAHVRSERTVIVNGDRMEQPPMTGIVKNDILSGSTSVKAGTFIKDVRQVGYNRYRLETLDDKIIFADSRNVFVFRDLKDPGDVFAITQAALGLMLKNDFIEAVYYTRLAAHVDGSQKRSRLLEDCIRLMHGSELEVRKANAAVSALNKEIEDTLKLVERNHNAMKDQFAVRAGMQDRTDTLAAKAVLLREKRKQVQSEMKDKLKALDDFCRDEVRKTAASGDFIAACLINDMLVRKITQLRHNADLTWDEDEENAFRQSVLELREFIVDEYCRKIHRPFTDRWSVFLDRYVKDFGEDEAVLAKFDLEPAYHNLLAASRASIAETQNFSLSVFHHDFSGVFNNGMKILLIMPHADIAESIRVRINNAFEMMDRTVKNIKTLSAAKLYGKVLEVSAKLNPLPLALHSDIETAEIEVAKSNAALVKAEHSAKINDYAAVYVNITSALEIWPGNVAAQKFYNEFMRNHKDIMRDAVLLEGYIKQGRFRDALDKCNVMFKEYPGYRELVKGLRLKIEQAISEYSLAMVSARNYFKAGRYEDALRIYVRFQQTEHILSTYQAMLDRARKNDDIKAQIKYLELLEMWDEAGSLRRKHSVQ
ncbi:MAG: hypothetical protein JXR78_05345 [Victivallales bacterium]|nr:hypothetical protein [Victivallales bacterium]